VVLEQARAARRILARRKPDRVVAFGGEYGVDFAPFAYLNERYEGELAVRWLDAQSCCASTKRNIESSGRVPTRYPQALGESYGFRHSSARSH
jgi:hypothetical protein